MPTLSDLVSEIAPRTDIPRATIFAYGRFARESGFISQKGRGKGAALMTETDAANLLIALGGTAATRDAAKAIKLFRPMRGFLHYPVADAEPILSDWLSRFNYIDEKKVRIDSDFGAFFDWLISEAISESLYDQLKKIPILLISEETLDLFSSKYRNMTLEEAVESGLLAPKIADVSNIGIDVELNIIFNRSVPMATVELRRKWQV